MGEGAYCVAEFMRIAGAFVSDAEPRYGLVKTTIGNTMFAGHGGGWRLLQQKKLDGMDYEKG